MPLFIFAGQWLVVHLCI